MYLIHLHTSHKRLSCLMSYAGLHESMASVGLSETSLLTEEHEVHGASNLIDTPLMIMASKEEPIEDSDDTDPNYTLNEHPSEPDYTPPHHSSPNSSEPVYSRTTH